ncbi:uncharacterized protein LOC119465047 isoform X2 [Dermacentor silvarum]|uniref:uncharacterized protein LOC119465047 isoform X2 n=1 Tax=Dermacentor silvarum TaxID=543639 RepID=UPI00189AFCB0|nr:uncharacterized protein LOC119465047 isoform X2 [Dermacentor silvarum]
MAKEMRWPRRRVPVLGRLPALVLLTGLAVTVVRGQNAGASDPCWYGNYAECQASCSRYYGAGGRCRGYQCVCTPSTMFPGYPPQLGPQVPPQMGPQMGPQPGFGSRMSEEMREVPCLSGNPRCEQFCVQHTGYGGTCHGQACKCYALTRR